MNITFASPNRIEEQPGNPVSPRLVKAAQEFEAQMMKELLQPMTGQNALMGDETDGGDTGATGALGEFASEALGQAISQNGGFGIAQRIVQELSRSGHVSAEEKMSGAAGRFSQ